MRSRARPSRSPKSPETSRRCSRRTGPPREPFPTHRVGRRLRGARRLGDVLGLPGQKVEIQFKNASECTWADAFGKPYRAYVSEGSTWARAETRYDGEVLIVRHTLTGP